MGLTLREEEMRGEEARRILEHPVYLESWQAIRDRVVAQLESADLAPDKRARLNDLLVAHSAAQKYMRSVLTSGTMAAMEINRQRTLAEKAAERVKRWAA